MAEETHVKHFSNIVNIYYNRYSKKELEKFSRYTLAGFLADYMKEHGIMFQRIIEITDIKIDSVIEFNDAIDVFKKLVKALGMNNSIVIINTTIPQEHIAAKKYIPYDKDNNEINQCILNINLGFTSIKSICDSHHIIPYLFVNKTAIPLLKEVLSLEL